MTDRPISDSRRTADTARGLALSLVVLLLLFIGTEIGFRLFYCPENLGTVIRFDPMTGWSLKADGDLRSVDYQHNLDYTIHINSIGLRERELSIEKPQGKQRVLVLGDSFVFGTGLEEGWRFSDFMDRALGGEVEVVNAGIPGFGTDQALILLETFGARLDPDVVIVEVTLTNDVLNNMLDHLFMGTAPKPRFVLDADTLKLLGSPVEPPARPGDLSVRKLLRKSRLLVFVKRRLDMCRYEKAVQTGVVRYPRGFDKDGLERNYSHWSVHEKAYNEELERAFRVTEAILRRFSRRCEEMGAELIVFAFPEKIGVDVSWREALMSHAGVAPDRFDFVKPYERVRAFCAQNGIEFYYPLDTFGAEFRKRALHFEIDGHPNRYGNALAARLLLEVLDKRHGFDFTVAGSDKAYVYPDL